MSDANGEIGEQGEVGPSMLSEVGRSWVGRPGDTYVPMFGDFFGNPEVGYHHEWSVLGERGSWAQAKSNGLRAQHSDDFNIVVIRDHRVVALLWMHEVIDDEQSTLDTLSDVLGLGHIGNTGGAS